MWLKIKPGYREYADCFDLDIRFTLDKDCNNRRDERRAKELRMQ